MTRGIIYLMTSVVDGLVKIGKTNDFEKRMNHLEKNGYANITGLKREFAIEVSDYDDKEHLLHAIFNKSRVAETELFALDKDLVISLLSSFEGTQIYPANKSKEEVFEEASEATERKAFSHLPEGEYHLKRRVKRFGSMVHGKAVVRNGVFTVLKGSICAPIAPSFMDKAPKACKDARIEDNILMEDIICTSPSTAGEIIVGNAVDGWEAWQDAKERPIDFYRDK